MFFNEVAQQLQKNNYWITDNRGKFSFLVQFSHFFFLFVYIFEANDGWYPKLNESWPSSEDCEYCDITLVRLTNYLSLFYHDNSVNDSYLLEQLQAYTSYDGSIGVYSSFQTVLFILLSFEKKSCPTFVFKIFLGTLFPQNDCFWRRLILVSVHIFEKIKLINCFFQKFGFHCNSEVTLFFLKL